MPHFNRPTTNNILTLIMALSWLAILTAPTKATARPSAASSAAPPGSEQSPAEDENTSPPVVALTRQLTALLAAKKPDQAKVLLRKYRLHNQCSKDFYLAVAGAYCDNRSYKEAGQYLTEGLGKYPKSSALHFLNAHAWLKVGELDLAEPELRACLSISPNSQKVHAELAKVLNEREDYASALKEVDTAIAAGPEDVDIWTTKGCVLRNLGRTEEALAAFDKAVELSHNADFNIRKLRVPLLKRSGRYDQAIKEYLYLVKVDPKHDFYSWGDIGDCYMAMKKPRDALTYFDLALKSKSDYIASHRGRLAALEALKDTKAAEQEKKIMLKLEEEYTPIK